MTVDCAILEKTIKGSGKNLVREVTPSLVTFKDAAGNFFCGYKVQPKKVTFYFQPLYDRPEAFASLEADLASHRRGKSCLHFKGEGQIDKALVEKLFELV